MKKLTVYQYPKCSTCRNALKWLKEHGYEVESIDIVEHPPSVEELTDLIAKSGLELKAFFNTSGQVYKEQQLKDKLPGMTREEQIRLLSSNGKLIKRPIVTDGTDVTAGFREAFFAERWGNA
ncbi:arsenate reductase family protein [Xylanibacillus composti]|uniref:Arsenate reductase family protein n=1 Tax=Xylanibacillus composti TaxID=1572762 RepID=A0A8J4H8K9_9BACL|nr:arsenate reductase family protein [Xylanibacillus composti]MDT9724687.1 arsenate reductase family protein [Xylanibacillus composti]GIQ70973.1 hypothetical protein XYCOK13_37970 [Xylanibacillus composti]